MQQPTRYFTDSAHTVFSDRTIWWRIPVLAAIDAVPFFGSFLTMGYAMIVMREAAWRTGRRLPSFAQVGEILTRGVHGFVISLVYGLVLVPLFMLALLVWAIPNFSAFAEGAPPAAPWWLALTIATPSALLAPFVYASLLRSAIYLTASAGLNAVGVLNMIALRRKTFLSVAGIALAVAVLGVVLSIPAMTLSRILELPALVRTIGTLGLGLVLRLVSQPLALIVATAYGSWASETIPSTWPPERDAHRSQLAVADEQLAEFGTAS